MSINNEQITSELSNLDYVKRFGKVTRIVGLTIESIGPAAEMGELCLIHPSGGEDLVAEVVGFKDNNLLLMPLGEMTGIGINDRVEALGKSLEVKIDDNLLGRVVDGLGNIMDDLGEYECTNSIKVQNEAPNALARTRISERLHLGVKAIDGTLTIGKGQRIGIFAGSGVGKSTLMGMIARNALSDINVIALIGERGREVKEFIERDLGPEGLKRSIVVVATSDAPSLVRQKAAYVATSIAEYFRNQGKDVMLMLDSLTRFAMAQREIGLAIGEPPVSKGYPPSVFTSIPKLLERAGTDKEGSITAIYTVLVEGDDLTEPVTDTARGVLDGHIVLDRNLAYKNHYPSIDVLASISRLMSEIATPEHKELAKKLRNVLATYANAEDLINVGAYAPGSNPEIDFAISKINMVNNFLMQETSDNVSYTEMLEELSSIFLDGE
ncbi:MAG: flagellar protein export ATPase FliI [Clostridia bacterium]|nr:flagellar protein export ATPase FliI [Clostridia bacterium]